ncbi:MAG: hypothetical protein U0L92_02525 [Clostridia bacterium]|nr:hypothetical protein [Clostridia bacterium]
MKEDKLGNLSMELSVEVLNLVKDLRNKKENIISNQIGSNRRRFHVENGFRGNNYS